MTEAEYEARLAAKRDRAQAAQVVQKLRTAHILLPWPPTANTNVRHGAGHHYLTAKHKMFRNDVAVRVVAAGLHKDPLTGSLKVTIHASPKDKRARDLDNIAKPILDALQHAGLYLNDSAIDDLRIIRTAAIPGTCNVFVETLMRP